MSKTFWHSPLFAWQKSRLSFAKSRWVRLGLLLLKEKPLILHSLSTWEMRLCSHSVRNKKRNVERGSSSPMPLEGLIKPFGSPIDKNGVSNRFDTHHHEIYPPLIKAQFAHHYLQKKPIPPYQTLYSCQTWEPWTLSSLSCVCSCYVKSERCPGQELSREPFVSKLLKSPTPWSLEKARHSFRHWQYFL